MRYGCRKPFISLRCVSTVYYLINFFTYNGLAIQLARYRVSIWPCNWYRWIASRIFYRVKWIASRIRCFLGGL